MKLINKGIQFEFDKLPSSDEVVAKINELLEGNYYFSHFIADGMAIYENHEDYLIANMERIEKLEVIAKTEKEFLNDILLSTENYLQRAKPELTTLSDGFYSKPSTEIRISFRHLMEGLQWLNKMFALIDNSKERPTNWDVCMELDAMLKAEIVNLSEAVENNDNILIADLIQYEFSPVFEALKNEITKTIDTVGVRYDLS